MIWGLFLSGTLFAVSIICYMFCRKKKSCDMKRSYFLTEWDKKCMAYHEAGHAVCSYFLPEREKLIYITINPSDNAFGMIKTMQRQDHNATKTSMMSDIAVFLAGRISEEMFLGIQTTSCIYDIFSANETAKDMAGKFGMGRQLQIMTGVSFADNNTLLFSEYFKKMLDEDIFEIIITANSIAKKIINEHKELVCLLANLLLEKKTLSDKEIDAFFQNRRR